MPERNVGVVIEWHPARGHGFLRDDRGDVYFLGARDLKRYGIDIESLSVGQRLAFDPTRDSYGLGRAPRAINVRIIV
jgi:hypothetical protein